MATTSRQRRICQVAGPQRHQAGPRIINDKVDAYAADTQGLRLNADRATKTWDLTDVIWSPDGGATQIGMLTSAKATLLRTTANSGEIETILTFRADQTSAVWRTEHPDVSYTIVIHDGANGVIWSWKYWVIFQCGYRYRPYIVSWGVDHDLFQDAEGVHVYFDASWWYEC